MTALPPAAERRPVALTVNGLEETLEVEPRRSLLDALREDLGLTGSHAGCEQGACGACSLLVDGVLVRGCLMLAVQAEGCRVETVEGLADRGALAALQVAFKARNALQCGFCTPGMLVTAADLLARDPDPSRAAIREHLSGNYCRCTGYQAIVDAVEAAARALREARP